MLVLVLTDVAPGNVLNHFATPDLLAEAVIEQITGGLQVLDGGIFRGTRSASAPS